MDNKQFLSSVRNKINKKKNRTATIFYSMSIVSVFVISFFLRPVINNNSIDSYYFSQELNIDVNHKYILTEEDILIYLIDEMDIDEFLLISVDEDFLYDFNIINEEI